MSLYPSGREPGITATSGAHLFCEAIKIKRMKTFLLPTGQNGPCQEVDRHNLRGWAIQFMKLKAES